jgi:flagellar hook-associated protein 2
MPVTFGGMSGSGVDTDGVIRKLVEVEARPIYQWEEDKKNYTRRKETLNLFKNRLNDLSNAVKELYGFRAVYNDKRVVSSDPSVLDATATKYAEKGVKKIIVTQLASTHKLSSDSIEETKTIPAGKFKIEVNGESKQVKFKGGSIKSLYEKIEDAASDIIITSYINTYDKNYAITMESRTTGRKGEIKLSGDLELLKAVGLAKGEKEGDKEKVDIAFDEKYFASYAGEKKTGDLNGRITVDKGGKQIKMKGNIWKEYILPVEIHVKDTTSLEIGAEYSEEKTAEDSLPDRLEIGPEEKVNIKGIELKGYNISRNRPVEKKDSAAGSDVIGVGLVYYDNGKRVEKLYEIDRSAKGKRDLPVGGDLKGRSISRMIFYCSAGEAQFTDARLVTTSSVKGLLEPSNVVNGANDAKMKVEGIELIRDKNDGLSDIVKGVTMNLKGKSDREVTITVESDIKKAVDKIRKFVEVYNAYLDFNKEITRAEKTAKAGEYRKNTMKNGPFLGDTTILRLENTLKTAVSSAYPSKADNPLKLIVQVGISTGALNAEWETIREGKLVIDEDKLTKTISDNPDGVREFFGSDTDGDNKVDNGMAFRLEYILKPYITSGKNIIQTKIEYEEHSLKTANEKIDRHQDHLKHYEDKLRRKFAAMERSVSGSKKQSQWLNQQMNGMKTNDKEK